MRTDHAIQQDAEQQLQRDPDLDAIHITVSVKDGIVALAGRVFKIIDGGARTFATDGLDAADGVMLRARGTCCSPPPVMPSDPGQLR